MFSGIVERTTKLLKIEQEGTNKTFTFENKYPGDIYIDQSITHNGVCLTVVEFNDEEYKVVAIKETLDVSNLGLLHEGDLVNLERSIMASTRLDGHTVQGHVDDTGEVTKVEEFNGSWEYTISYPSAMSHLIIHKGSIALNGISLTVKEVSATHLKVAIIPYTYEHTNVKNWNVGTVLNLEYDILGKYIAAYMDKINAR